MICEITPYVHYERCVGSPSVAILIAASYGPYYLIGYQGYIYALSQPILHARLTVS